MTEAEAIQRTAERYRTEGYSIALAPDSSMLPPALADRRPALIATKNGSSVLVEIWSRDRINELPPTFLPSGWEFDIVSLPSSVPADAPGPVPAATPEFTRRLLEEVEEYIPRAAPRARLLVAWSALESAMRVAAQRVGRDASGVPPRQLIGELTSDGVLSQEQSSYLRSQIAVRNRVSHGVPENDFDHQHVDRIIALARELLSDNAVQAA